MQTIGIIIFVIFLAAPIILAAIVFSISLKTISGAAAIKTSFLSIAIFLFADQFVVPETMSKSTVIIMMIFAGAAIASVLYLLFRFINLLRGRGDKKSQIDSASKLSDTLSALALSGMMLFVGFIALSWRTAGMQNDQYIHTGLIVAAIFVALIAYLIKSWYLRCLVVGTTLTLATFTVFSWVAYPKIVDHAAQTVANGQPFCVGASSLTFLSAPKRTWGYHFALYTKDDAKEWSYRRFEFIDDVGGNPPSIEYPQKECVDFFDG